MRPWRVTRSLQLPCQVWLGEPSSLTTTTIFPSRDARLLDRGLSPSGLSYNERL